MSDAPLNHRDLERVIARAMEIDALGRPQTREALHKVAAQLDISPTAIDRALAEVLANEAPVGSSHSTDSARARIGESISSLRRWLTAGCVSTGSLVGLLLGSNYDLRGDDGDTIAAILVLFVISAGLVWIHRHDRKPLTMMARMAVLWSSFGYAWVIGFGEMLSWFVDTTAIAGGASLAVGAAVHMGRQAWIRMRMRRRQRGEIDTTREPSMLDLLTPVPRSFHTPV